MVAAVEDGDQLLAVLATETVDIALLDIRMPPEPDGGLTTARRIRQLYPGTGCCCCRTTPRRTT